MPSQQTAPSAFESGGSSAPTPPADHAAVAPPTFASPVTTLTPPVPKYETPQDELEQPGHVVTSSPEGVLPTRRYAPGSANGEAAPTVPLRFTRSGG